MRARVPQKLWRSVGRVAKVAPTPRCVEDLVRSLDVTVEPTRETSSKWFYVDDASIWSIYSMVLGGRREINSSSTAYQNSENLTLKQNFVAVTAPTLDVALQRIGSSPLPRVLAAYPSCLLSDHIPYTKASICASDRDAFETKVDISCF